LHPFAGVVIITTSCILSDPFRTPMPMNSGKMVGSKNSDAVKYRRCQLGRFYRTGAILVGIFSVSMCFAASAEQYAQFERIEPSYYETDVNKLVQITNPQDVVNKRKALIDYIWAGRGFCSSKLPESVQENIEDDRYAELFKSNLKQIDKITIIMDGGFNSIVYHFIPKKANKKLLLYHQGHRGDFIEGLETIRAFVGRGYAVMGFSMPLLGMNNKPTVYLERFGWFKVTRHIHMRLLDRPIMYFVEPIAVALNYAGKFGYKDMYMTGISGGGWTTTLYAAIDPRISRSYPVAGSLPIYLRSDSKRDWGDYEQTLPGLYAIANYLELYVMGASGNGRRQIQILNQYDSCCFAGIKYRTYEQAVTQRVSSIGEGGFWVYLDSTHREHKISDAALEAIFADIEENEALAGKFQPAWESLQQYECPEWFRDAKLGIFICWGPYTVPAVGDWYARHMYIEQHPKYKYHLEHYGHPSQFGYKDIIPLWKGEKFDADKLVKLFKQAGAKYIVPMAMHHDNYDQWNSMHQRWNSVNMGPKKDVMGLWREATLRHGLRFGMTTHLARSYSWLNTSKGSDKKGPYAGVPYDGADLNYEGLYHERHADTTKRYPRNPSEKWKRIWYLRIKDLVDNYQPDLLYFDGGVPFDQVGRRMVAYFYNENMRRHGGRLEAVLNIKHWPDGSHGGYREGMAVLDLERGMLTDIRDEPWQNDTSIGPWFYTKGAKYKSVDAIIDAFVDIVSKNGNLLLNISPKADGTIDAQAETILREMGKWMDVNGEAIYGTRPWKIYGEGPTVVEAGNFKEQTKPSTAQDIRFTTKGDYLYAICLGWPGDGAILAVKSLATERRPHEISEVKLLGYGGPVKWRRDSEALKIQLPAQKPGDYAFAFKIK